MRLLRDCAGCNLLRRASDHRAKTAGAFRPQAFFDDNWEDATGFVPDTYLDITPVFERWMDACAVFPMWRGENGFRYDDYYRSLAVARGCVANFEKAVTLMSPPEQQVRHVHTL